MALRSWTDQINADIWVLTETHDGFKLGLPYYCSSAAARDGHHDRAHHWVTIWSKWRLEQLEVTDLQRTSAARVFPDDDAPFLVFGTVLPWLGSAWREYPSAKGHAFAAALRAQEADWIRLREQYPEDELFVLGDFNQDLVSSKPRYYGSHKNREALHLAFIRCGLMPITGGDGDPIRRDSAPYACIDHICARYDTRWSAEPATRWPIKSKPSKSLSDHFGVAVTFDKKPVAPARDPDLASAELYTSGSPKPPKSALRYLFDPWKGSSPKRRSSNLDQPFLF